MKKHFLLFSLFACSSIVASEPRFFSDQKSRKGKEWETICRRAFNFLSRSPTDLSEDDYQRIIGTMPLSTLLVFSMLEEENERNNKTTRAKL